jgi:hypothetical protein
MSQVQVRGGREIRAALAKYDDREARNKLMRALRAGAAIYRDGLRSEAKSRDDLPHTFSKTKTKSQRGRNTLLVSVRPASPLFVIFEEGADPHQISGGVMAGKGGDNYRARDFFARGTVHHPGMAARPLLAPVFAAKTPLAEAAVDKAFFG